MCAQASQPTNQPTSTNQPSNLPSLNQPTLNQPTSTNQPSTNQPQPTNHPINQPTNHQPTNPLPTNPQPTNLNQPTIQSTNPQPTNQIYVYNAKNCTEISEVDLEPFSTFISVSQQTCKGLWWSFGYWWWVVLLTVAVLKVQRSIMKLRILMVSGITYSRCLKGPKVYDEALDTDGECYYLQSLS